MSWLVNTTTTAITDPSDPTYPPAAAHSGLEAVHIPKCRLSDHRALVF